MFLFFLKPEQKKKRKKSVLTLSTTLALSLRLIYLGFKRLRCCLTYNSDSVSTSVLLQSTNDQIELTLKQED